MSEDRQPSGSKGSTLSTGGLGAVFAVAVAAYFPDSNTGLAKLAYTLIPFVAASIIYVMNWVISRHGFESPADASKRAKCKRDIKEINKQLKISHPPEFIEELKRDREKTTRILVNIGRESSSDQPPAEA